MRVLYANRRLSAQFVSEAIPSTEADDGPLVHDILNSLGLLEDSEPRERSKSDAGSPKSISISSPCPENPSTPSRPPSPTALDTESPTSLDFDIFSDIPAFPDPNYSAVDFRALDTDLDLDFCGVDWAMNENLSGFDSGLRPNFGLSQGMVLQDWDPLSVLQNVMNGGITPGQYWMTGTSNSVYSDSFSM